MKNKLPFASYLTFFFGWPLGLIALYFITRIILPHWTEVLDALSEINWILFLIGLFCLFVYFLFRIFLWQKILHNFHIYANIKQTAYFWSIAEVKRYIPGSVFSIASRIVHFSGDKTTSAATIGKAYLTEAQLIVLGSLCVSLLSLPFISLYLFPLPVLVTIACIVLTVFAVLFYLYQHTLFHFLTMEKLMVLFAQNTLSQRVILLTLSLLSFVFFGLGNFFLLFSLAPLNVQYLFLFSGFFVLSYLIGYLSFITPTGLGVREGVITYGLYTLLGENLSGFIALFVRIQLLLVELVVLLLSFLWYKNLFPFHHILTQFIKKYWHALFLALAILLYCWYFTTASFLRYDNFYTGRFDLGNMDQTVWNTLHGRFFQLTDPNGVTSVSRLATHADYFLVLLTPFYRIWADPRMLLLLQTLILGLGAIYIYVLGNTILKNKSLALLFACMYLLNPSVERTNLYEFHAVTFATTFLLAAFYYLLQKRYVLFSICAILAGLTKEQVWFLIALIGLFIAIKQKKYLFGIVVFLLGTGLSYYLIEIAIPQALGSQHFALSYYSDFGDNPASIAKNILFSPVKTFSVLFTQGRVHYLEQIFLPLAGLSLFAPLYLLFSLPELFIYLLSNNENLHQIYYQYTATITPFLFISALYGLAKLRIRFPKLSQTMLLFGLSLVTFLTSFAYGPLPGELEPNIDMFTHPLNDRQTINDFLQHIPRRYSVASSNNLGSHLSRRKNIYTIPVGVDHADVIAFLLTDPNAMPSPAYHRDLVAKLKKDNRYTIWYQKDDFIVFKKITLPSSQSASLKKV